MATVSAAGITHIDIVISTAGVSIGAAPMEHVDPKAFTDSSDINALAPIMLFQAAKSLLERSPKPRWISVSSRAASTAAPLPWYFYAAAYGMSKAAMNWFTQ